MKHTLTFLIAAAALLSFASCATEELSPEIAKTVTQTVTFVLDEDDELKASLDGNLPKWEAGDKIWISNGTEAVTVTLSKDIISGNRATVGINLSGTEFTAVYPADAHGSIDGDKVGIMIPNATDGTFANAHIAVARGGNDLHFKNAVSILKITVDNTVKGINIAAKSQVCGSFKASFGQSLSVTADNSAGQDIILVPATSGVQYVAVGPGTIARGTAFTVIKEDNSWAEKMLGSDKNVEISKMYDLEDVSNWDLAFDTSGSLWGEFSVSDEKKVHFSKGNLRYTVDTGEWSFFDQQYECGPSTYEGGHDKEISLFSWGYNPVLSIIPDSYTKDMVERTEGDLSKSEDWGYVFGGESSPWRTLSGGGGSEYYYLARLHPASKVGNESSARFAKVKVDHMAGVLLFPDRFIWATSLMGDVPEGINNYLKMFWPEDDSQMDYSIEQFTAMEVAGAVFLPSAGHRYRNSCHDWGERGNYWSSTAYTYEKDGDCAGCFCFEQYVAYDEWTTYREEGCSVRLVKDSITPVD